jgi:hypothetical protein
LTVPHSEVAQKDRVCRYLASEKARWEPAEGEHASRFVFDARRAVQLAKRHGKREVGWQLLVEIGAFEEALALSTTYEERVSVIEEVSAYLWSCFSSHDEMPANRGCQPIAGGLHSSKLDCTSIYLLQALSWLSWLVLPRVSSTNV